MERQQPGLPEMGAPVTEIPRYAKLENERRWLVPPESRWRELATQRSRRLLDRYLASGRLRVREMIDSDTGHRVYKLTKKYETVEPMSRPITTLYLTREEHDALEALPGHDLIKVRHYVEEARRVFGVDVFEGPLAGLVICETESDTLAQARAVRAPAWAGREVTAEKFFTCGHLATLSAEELAGVLSR